MLILGERILEEIKHKIAVPKNTQPKGITLSPNISEIIASTHHNKLAFRAITTKNNAITKIIPKITPKTVANISQNFSFFIIFPPKIQ